MGALSRLRELWRLTRPVSAELERALERRWRELPAHVKTASQALGRRTGGCEGTHGVFPRCNLACTPCYHSRAANRVPTDGAHTVAEVERQMSHLSRVRGPGQHAQLIGGEVTLLAPEDHAAALLEMRRHGRKPMSMSHGDFDYEHLRRLAVGADGRRHFDRLSFAGHFDSTMLGRRGIPAVEREASLHPSRRAFCTMFERLRRETGVASYLAHNMTVTPANLGQVAEVVGAASGMGFRMLSFQPAAFVGNASRWREDYRAIDPDEVWAEIERGAGARLPFRAVQLGDERCNRSAYGGYVGRRWVPLLDDRVAADLAARDAFYATIGGIDFDVARPLLAARVLRAIARRPRAIPVAAGWLLRFGRRAGVAGLLRHGFRPLTYVMHNFMDAGDVAPAWELIGRGERSADPRIHATQERLAACSYHMAHPETGQLVPACAQHAVLDPEANEALARRLPLAAKERRAEAEAVVGA